MKTHLTFNNLVHAVMVTFAVASLGNVASFINLAHGSHLVAYALGAAIGAVLVVTSIMLTKIDRQHERETFITISAIVAVSAVLSGTIQYWAYSAHLSTLQAVILGYGVPVVGEACLAYAASMYSQAQRRAVIRSATDGTQDRIAEIIADSLSNIDTSKVKRQVAKTVDQIVMAQVNEVARTMMPATTVAAVSNSLSNGASNPLTNATVSTDTFVTDTGTVTTRPPSKPRQIIDMSVGMSEHDTPFTDKTPNDTRAKLSKESVLEPRQMTICQ